MGQSNKLGFLEIEAKEVESDRHQVGLSQFVNSNRCSVSAYFYFYAF